jgi:tetratricopeptide (TPR) repeat protein
MTTSDLLQDPARLWQRVHDGLATAILGRLPEPPPELHLLRVSCEVAPAALRPLLEARRLTEAVLGDARKPEKAKSTRRRSLFGDTPERATEAVVVELWNQLARQKGVRWVVVFDAVEQADDATLAALAQIVRRPGWMKLPLLLVFHGEPKGAAAELLAAVRASGDEGAIAGEQQPGGEAEAFPWRTLPAEVLRVLRAGALIGPGFETRIVADLLALEPLAVLERLQQAIDLGVPLEDRGEGRFSLPTSALTALSTSLMPSLAQAWHRRLGRLLGARAGEVAPMPPRPPAPPPGNAKTRRERLATPGDALAAEIIDLSAEAIDLSAETDAGPALLEAAPEVAPGSGESGVFAPEPPDMLLGTGDAKPAVEVVAESPAPAVVWSKTRRRTMLAQPGPAQPEPEPEQDPAGWGMTSRVVPTRLDDPLVDEVRAAEHLRLAGDVDAAAQHLCEAARKAADMGAPQAAAQHANAAIALLDSQPSSAVRRQLKVMALIELGRLQWQAAGFDLGFTLAQALATLESARAEQGSDAPVELAAELAQAIAGVCFDLGDAASLARALAELESASETLTRAGDTIGAACLLNDQAAVLVRMGHPGRAVQLLRASRQFFDARVHDDPVALRELAETELLFARLPLHAQLRPGREQEGYAMGLEHALASERAFHELGEARELGRVWETMGRLELRRGRIEPARQRLEAAVEVQTQLGDLTGLATATEALSEVLVLCGRDAEAVTLLRDSIVFNRDKGSPLGLMCNRRAFTALAGRLATQPEHAAGLLEASILLAAGERELGVQANAAQ